MHQMFRQASAFNQTLCGAAWVDSTGGKEHMFTDSGTNAGIAKLACSFSLQQESGHTEESRPKAEAASWEAL